MNSNKPTITVHCLVRNEEKWVWYAVNSLIDFVDKILVFDTGSTDRTVEIIRSIKSPKIIFEEKGIVDKKRFTQLRQEMLDRTNSGWFMILDGDEVWPKAAIEELVTKVKQAPEKRDAVVAGEWVCIGDVFHYSKALEHYKHSQYPGHTGFKMVRAIRNIPSLYCIGDYGYESYSDKNSVNVSYWDRDRLIFLKGKFFHMSFLQRSSSIKKDREVMLRAPKRFFYKGKPFPENMVYPDVFYKKRPNIVSSPWRKLTLLEQLKGLYYRVLNLLDRKFKV